MISKEKTIPKFINVGPGRIASTWFYKTLGQHPKLCFSKIKETEYFNTNYERGVAYYLNFFNDCDMKVCGEVSNLYYCSEACLKRISEDLPDVRIIFNIRNPFSLLGSMYTFSLRRGLSFSPEEFLMAPLGVVMGSGYEYRRRNNKLVESDQITVLQSVSLKTHIENIQKYFSEQQVYFLLLDSVASAPDEVLTDLFEFLGVDNVEICGSSERVNSAIVARSPAIGMIATRTASWLRQVGAYRVLALLHESDLLKRVLYSRPSSNKEGNYEFSSMESAATLHRDLSFLEDSFGVKLTL